MSPKRDNVIESAAGFKEDAELLLTVFENCESVRHEVFCQVWRDMEFSKIFAGRESLIDLKIFTSRIFYIAKKFVIFKQNALTQVGGLYLLHGLYFKQPIKDLVKIRLTLDEWKIFTDMFAELWQSKHLDTYYIGLKMAVYDCFEFVATHSPSKIECLWWNQTQMNNDTFLCDMMQSCYQRLENTVYKPHGMLETLDELAKRYTEAKVAIDDKSISLLKLNDPSLSPDLENLMKILEEDPADDASTSK